ncbi:MAG: alcohol dehydrogenase catalytic domain-containing protein [Bacteroidales bacterium]|nr:alcohol dehydrogenase catalytic domain-containing protein [Bacteroidales bacterium]
MKAVQFNATVPKYLSSLMLGKLNKNFFFGPLACTRFNETKEPELPDRKWVKIKTKYSGICGSDLNVIFLKDSPSTSPFVSFPFVFGHEVVGEITEAGNYVDNFEVGDRVVVNPLLSCIQRNIACPCQNCLDGNYSLCENFTKGSLSPGISIGFCKDTGGGWGDYFVAHQSQLFKVPDNVTDEQVVFTDPLASALHPVMKNMPKDDDKILIIGMGVIGLLMVAALRVLGSNCNITVLARYDFQGEIAKQYGADQVIYTKDDYYSKFRDVTGGFLYQPIIGKRFMIRGFDKVFDCVASDSTLDTAIKFTNAGGTMIVVGLASIPRKVDWTPVWFKEINIKGSFYYNEVENGEGKIHSFKKAFDMIVENKIDISPLLTHTFQLKDYRKAIKTASDKSKYQSIKVLFKF